MTDVNIKHGENLNLVVLTILDELIASFSVRPSCVWNTMKFHLNQLGFDIFHQFPIQSYNSTLSQSSKYAHLLPLNEYANCQTISILVGNTSHLWPVFIRELKMNPNKWKHRADPLDEYTVSCMESVCETYLKPNNIEYTLRFSFETEPDKLVSFQTLSHVSHLALLDTNSFLCIHPQYGPWIALRAVIILNIAWDQTVNQIKNKHISSLNDICTKKEQETVRKQWKEIQRKKNCDWSYWLKLRDSYDIGKEYRYDEDQILYHYTKDMDILRRLCQWY